MKHRRRYKHNYPQVTVIHKHYHYYIEPRFKQYEPYDRVSDLAHSVESNQSRPEPDYRQGGGLDEPLGGGFSGW